MAHFLAFGWSGHGDYSFNCDRVELGAIHSGNMAHEGGFANKEFHLVEIQLDMTLFKSPKHADKDTVVVDWTSLAPEPGIKMPSVIQKPRRPSSTIWIWSCHSLDAEVMPNGCLVHLWRPHGVNIVVIRDDLKDKGLFCLFESYSLHAACECFFSKVEMIYFGHRMALLRVWEGSKAARIFPVWWGLVLAFGWDTLTSLPVVSYASRVALIASRFEMGSQWLGAWMGLTSGFRSRPTGGPQKPRPWKSEVQFLEMNSRVQVPSVGQIRIDVSTESIWKEICTLQFESGLSKRNKTKWPLLEGDAIVVTPVSRGCPLERVKKFSYCMPSLGRV